MDQQTQKAESFEEDQEPPYKASQNGEVGALENERDALIIRLESYEGPLDVLLEMAREQKVDLAQIEIVPLVDQYIAFIEAAKDLEIVVAADYLVMAAWLTYLKSKLLLPEDDAEGEEPSGQMMAEALAYQLKRLEAIRAVGEKLLARPKLYQDFWPRGNPEGLVISKQSKFDISLMDIMQAYGDIERRKNFSSYRPEAYQLLSLDEALERLERLVGKMARDTWLSLKALLPEPDDVEEKHRKNKLYMRSQLASTLVASLEMAKSGLISLRQDQPFDDILLMRKG